MAGGASEPLSGDQPGPAPPASQARQPPAGVPRRRSRAIRMVASLVLVLSTGGIVIGWWIWNVLQVRTSNAYVVGNITPVSSDVGGQVVALYADDNMLVAAGVHSRSSIRYRSSLRSIGHSLTCAMRNPRCAPLL